MRLSEEQVIGVRFSEAPLMKITKGGYSFYFSDIFDIVRIVCEKTGQKKIISLDQLEEMIDNILQKRIIMKAKAYAEKLNEANKEEVVIEFALETRELIDNRSKFSNDDKSTKSGSKNYVVEGVLREQRQKWNAICNQNNVLSPSEFDSVIVAHLNDVHVAQTNWKNKLEEDKTKPKQEKGNDGRKLVKPVAPRGEAANSVIIDEKV